MTMFMQSQPKCSAGLIANEVISMIDSQTINFLSNFLRVKEYKYFPSVKVFL